MFPTRLDLNEFVDKSVNKKEDVDEDDVDVNNIYILHSVLVHSVSSLQ